LLGIERAIVTEIAGTTRDALEAATSFGGWPVRLVDTAGLRDTAERIERIGVEVTRRWVHAADLVLLCVEAGREPDPEEIEWLREPRTLPVRTKSDLAAGSGGTAATNGEIAVSTVTGHGLDALAHEIATRAAGGASSDGVEPLVTRERHRAALTQAAAALDEAAPHLASEGDPVLASHHIREAIAALEGLVGLVDVEDVLDRLFSTFCVGK
jgi:tRNA modification GTPase